MSRAYASDFNIIFSRIFKWRICGRDIEVNPAVVIPIERDFTAEETRFYSNLVVSSRDDYDTFQDLLTLDPRNKNMLFHQMSQCNISGLDLLSNLCFDILNYITDFLNLESYLNLRMVNRMFLINQIETSRFKFYKSIGSKISSGFDNFHRSTLSASYFNSLEKPLHYLLSNENRTVTRYYYCKRLDGSISRSVIEDVKEIQNKLDKVTNFIDFIMLSIHFYRRTDLSAFWELLEVLLKIEFINPAGFITYTGFEAEEILYRACQLGCLCIVKSLLNDRYVVTRLNLYSGAFTALESGHFKLFKFIILKLKKSSIIKQEIDNLLEKAVSLDKVQFAQFLFDVFGFLSYSDSPILFFAIRNRNIEMTRMIISFKGVPTIYKCFYFDMRALEIAAKFNFHEGIRYFLWIDDRIDLTLIASAIKVAIRFHSFEALQTLIEDVAAYNPLDDIYSKSFINVFLSTSITYRNEDAIKFILRKITYKSIDELGHDFENVHTSNIYFCNMIHYSIKCKFEQGLDALIEHFGIKSLEATDGLGRTPFLLAINYKSLYYAVKIAQLNPKSVMIPDIGGNTALHFMITSGYSLEFIKEISDLNLLCWETRNNSNLTPLDILETVKTKFPEKYVQELLNFLLESLNK